MMIKQTLKRTRLGQSLLAFKRVFQSENYRQWFRDFDESHSFFKFQECGPANEDKALYVINDVNASSGFFYSWCQVCRGLMVAERYGFTPVVDWTNGPYFDEKGLNGCMNPFEYFFEPLSCVTIDEAMRSRNVTFYSNHTDGGPFALYEYRSEEELERFAEINRKYLHIRSELRNRLYAEIHQLLGEKKTLAVHVRGVEWGNVRYHPIPASLMEYSARIDAAMAQNRFEQIFLATDSEDTVAFFKERYREAVVCYGDVIRAQKGSKVLAIFDDSIAEENKGFRLGYEVLKDMLTISSCDGIIAGLSYVSFAAEVYKKERGETYQYKDHIQMKLNDKGIAPIAVPNIGKEGAGCPSKSKSR